MYKVFRIKYKISDEDRFEEKLDNVYCEIKPLLGEDYLNVLEK